MNCDFYFREWMVFKIVNMIYSVHILKCNVLLLHSSFPLYQKKMLFDSFREIRSGNNKTVFWATDTEGLFVLFWLNKSIWQHHLDIWWGYTGIILTSGLDCLQNPCWIATGRSAEVLTEVDCCAIVAAAVCEEKSCQWNKNDMPDESGTCQRIRHSKPEIIILNVRDVTTMSTISLGITTSAFAYFCLLRT